MSCNLRLTSSIDICPVIANAINSSASFSNASVIELENHAFHHFHHSQEHEDVTSDDGEHHEHPLKHIERHQARVKAEGKDGIGGIDTQANSRSNMNHNPGGDGHDTTDL